jgi:hypothetical protein
MKLFSSGRLIFYLINIPLPFVMTIPADCFFILWQTAYALTPPLYLFEGNTGILIIVPCYIKVLDMMNNTSYQGLRDIPGPIWAVIGLIVLGVVLFAVHNAL